MEKTTEKISDTQIKRITPIPATFKEEVLDYPQLLNDKASKEVQLAQAQALYLEWKDKTSKSEVEQLAAIDRLTQEITLIDVDIQDCISLGVKTEATVNVVAKEVTPQ